MRTTHASLPGLHEGQSATQAPDGRALVPVHHEHPASGRTVLHVEVTPEVRRLARRVAAHLDLRMPAAMTLIIRQAARSCGIADE
jgi:hypothetical protein